MRQHWRVLGWSARAAYADFRAVHTWRTWVFGWCLRMLFQVSLFGLVGALIGSDDVVTFLLVGTAVQAGMSSVAFVIQSAAWERQSGTLPLLLASPSHPFVVYVGRGVQWIVDGTIVGTVTLVVVGLVFDRGFGVGAVAAAAALLALTLTTLYFFGLLVAALTLGATRMRNLVSNVMLTLLVLLCGLQVPLDVWPQWVRAVSDVLPVTHGLAAMRTVLTTGELEVGHLTAQAGLLVAWAAAAAILFTTLFERLRRGGQVEFGD